MSPHKLDIVEAPIDPLDLPEQALLDQENAGKCSTRFEIFVTDAVQKRPSIIWWLTIVSCVIPASLFFAIDAPFFFIHVHRAIPLTIAGLFLIDVFLFLLTSFMDPGKLAPYSTELLLQLEQELRMQNPAEYDKIAFVVHCDDIRPITNVRRVRQWDANGIPVITEWCYVCKIFKPPRGHHCKLCHHCIERFDHHCPWLDNCVGLRNYRYFILLLISYGVLWICVIALTCTHTVLRAMQDLMNLFYIISSAVEITFACGSLHFLGILLKCQKDLLQMGITVHEFKRDQYFDRNLQKFKSPFNRGSLWKNIAEACWDPWRPPPVIPKLPDTTKKEGSGTIRPGYSRSSTGSGTSSQKVEFGMTDRNSSFRTVHVQPVDQV